MKYRHKPVRSRLRHTVRAGQILAVAGCLIWGGLQVANSTLALAAPASVTIVETDDDIARQYPGLPPAVARAIPSVVATQQIIDPSSQRGVMASGVIVDGHQVLTAAHNIKQGRELACGNTEVIAAGVMTNAAASRQAVTHASLRYGKTTDIALVSVQGNQNFDALPILNIANRQPEAGDTVYFINFQPTADGVMRSPALQSSSDPSKDHSKPAVFSGIVLGSNGNGLAVATGQGKSYGVGVADQVVRKGASGGAIVDANGRLVGLSVSSESLQANRSAASLVSEYRVRLADGQYQVAYMQPVGKSDVRKLSGGMVSCVVTR